MITSFEFGRTQVTESRVPPLAIVKALDAFEDFTAGLSSAVPLMLVNQFELEGGEEALRHRVGFGRQMRRNGALNRERSE